MKKIYKSRTARQTIANVIEARALRARADKAVKSSEAAFFAMIGGKDGEVSEVAVSGIGTVLVRNTPAPRTSEVLDTDALVATLTARFGAKVAADVIAAATVEKSTQTAPRWQQADGATALVAAVTAPTGQTAQAV